MRFDIEFSGQRRSAQRYARLRGRNRQRADGAVHFKGGARLHRRGKDCRDMESARGQEAIHLFITGSRHHKVRGQTGLPPNGVIQTLPDELLSLRPMVVSRVRDQHESSSAKDSLFVGCPGRLNKDLIGFMASVPLFPGIFPGFSGLFPGSCRKGERVAFR
jgi:hypothetical protein